MPEISDILEQHIDFNPATDFEAFLRLPPAKWVVYLLADAEDRPVQLLCVKNLRYSLKRRLGGQETIGLTKRVDYREIVRRVYWRRVDSAFEADWIYYEAARQLFPSTYQGMVGFRSAWFVHVDPDAPFPKYAKTIDLSQRAGMLLGPVEDKHATARLIELAQDAFDLCRYYNILLEAPKGKACAYKEMGKCPAPCDGSISMDQYRRLIQWSAETLVDAQEIIRQQTQRMRSAAADWRFELAAKIKAYIAQLSELGKGPFRHVRKLDDFRFVSLQRGPGSKQAKLFLITPGQIEELADLIAEPENPSSLLRTVLLAADRRGRGGLDEAGTHRIGIVSHHLFSAKATHGVFMSLADISEAAIAKAYKDLLKQKTLEPEEGEGEGVVKELQAMD